MLHKRTLIGALKAGLTDVPAASMNVTTREIGGEIAGEVRGLRAKRYGWEEITALLGERGLKMSRWTLARYMRGAPRTRKRKEVETNASGAAGMTEAIAGVTRRP